MIEETSFIKKRQQFIINIRKTNRQQILMKRRNIQQTFPQISKKNTSSIVDQSFRSYIIQVLSMTFQSSQLPILLQLLHSANIYDQHKAIISIRKLTLMQSMQFMNQLINKQIISLLVTFCQQNDYPQIKLQALWILTNLSSVSKQVTKLSVQCNIIPIISSSLDNPNKIIVNQAIWMVGNLAADSISYRDQLISVNSVIKILKYLDSNHPHQKILNAVWALTNLARGNPPPNFQKVKAVVPVICQVIKSKIINDQNTLSDSLWTIANLSEGEKIRVQRVCQTKVLPTIMQYLTHPNCYISIPSMRIVGNFSASIKQYTNQVLKNNFFDIALLLLDNQKVVIVKQICWIISNITAGNDQQILQFLQRQDLIQKLLTLYQKNITTLNCQILWIFANLERLDIPEMIQKLYLNINLIKMVSELFFSNQTKILYDTIICLHRILNLGQKCKKTLSDPNLLSQQCYKIGLVNKLQQLLENKQQKISNQTQNLFRLYFRPRQLMNDS